jgi:hypothetical protein
VDEFFETDLRDARNRDGIALVEPFHRDVPFGIHAEYRLLAGVDEFVDFRFFRSVWAGRVDETDYRVGITYGAGRYRIDTNIEIVLGLMDARRIEEDDLASVVRVYSSYRFSRGLWTVRNDADLLVDQRVEKARLSGVRTSYQCYVAYFHAFSGLFPSAFRWDFLVLFVVLGSSATWKSVFFCLASSASFRRNTSLAFTGFPRVKSSLS